MSTRALRNLCGALWDSIAPATLHRGRIRNLHSNGRQSRDHAEIYTSSAVGWSKSTTKPIYLPASRWRLFFSTPQLHHMPPLPAGRSRYILSRGFGTGFMAWQGVPGSTVTNTGPGSIAAAAVEAISAATNDRTSGGCAQCGRVGGMRTKSVDKSVLAMLSSAGKSAQSPRRGRIRPSLTPKKSPSASRHLSSPGRATGSSGGFGGFGGSSNGPGGAAAGGTPGGGGGQSNGNGDGKNGNGKKEDPPPPEEPHNPDPGILGRIAQIHRPTKDQMLAAATSVFARFRIRTKWALIRQMRPYNLEDFAALLQWLLVGHIIWVVVGTTTFFSIVLLLVNTVYAQGLLSPANHSLLPCTDFPYRIPSIHDWQLPHP